MKVKKLLIIPDKDNLEAYLEIAKNNNLGFEYNDFFLPHILDDEKKVADTINYYKSQIDLPDYCTSHGAFLDVTIFSDDRKIYEVSDCRIEQSLNIAQELGVKGVVFHTNYIPNFTLESYRKSWVERNYLYWSEKLRKYPQMNIYMENMFDTDWELLAELAEKLSVYDNFGICFDYAHAHVFGDEKKIDCWVEAFAPYVKHIHINDNDFKSDLHLALGEGIIDWNKFKEHYEGHFYDATVLLELKGVDKVKASLELLDSL